MVRTSARGTDANYGAAAERLDISLGLGTPRASAPFHANLDAPFRPLAPFVPEAHWEALERRAGSGRSGWRARSGHLLRKLTKEVRGRLDSWRTGNKTSLPAEGGRG